MKPQNLEAIATTFVNMVCTLLPARPSEQLTVEDKKSILDFVNAAGLEAIEIKIGDAFDVNKKLLNLTCPYIVIGNNHSVDLFATEWLELMYQLCLEEKADSLRIAMLIEELKMAKPFTPIHFTNRGDTIIPTLTIREEKGVEGLSRHKNGQDAAVGKLGRHGSLCGGVVERFPINEIWDNLHCDKCGTFVSTSTTARTFDELHAQRKKELVAERRRELGIET